MEEDILGFADVVVDLSKATLDFLVRVTGIGEGVLLLWGFAEFQTVVANYGAAGRSEKK